MLANDFLVAAHKASMRKPETLKKDNVLKKLLYASTASKDELKQELTEAEEIYDKLKNKIPKKKLAKIKAKITKLKKKIDTNEKEPEDSVEHDGEVITAPILNDLEDGLDEIDKVFNIPSEVTEEDENENLTPPKFSIPEPPKFSSKMHLLNIPAPPPKEELNKKSGITNP
ncbi:hypothetical protein ACFLTH_04260 [Bacteroidota bacterium]